MARYIEIIETKGNSIENRYRVPFEFSADDVADFNTNTGGGGSYEVATESPATGSNDTFTFTGPPTLVFRNGVMETSLGTVVGSTFVFDSNPNLNDVIEGLV